MKLITKKNFISIACISFTIMVLFKLIWEKVTGFKDVNYTENIFLCLGISVVITLVLAIHYYLQSLPFIPVLLGQYLVIVGGALGMVRIIKCFADVAASAYRDIFLSVTIPFIICAIVYYFIFFRQIKKANAIIETLNGR